MARAAGNPGRWSAGDAERWLLARELFGMRFGLDRMRRLMTALEAPADLFRAMHVVGTNGKSSTARMAAAILERHGLRTGAYLSPHLVSFAERIRVDGRDVSEEEFAAAVARAAHATELVDRTLGPDDRVTQFEALTAAALSELARQGADVAVVEAGLGGRYDATNILDAEVVVLTNVGLEHTRWLGPTIADIAREKLAVLKDAHRVGRDPVLVVGHGLHRDAEAEARLAAARHGARLVHAPPDVPPSMDLLARGAYQRRNFATARAAAEALLGELDDDAVAAAAASTLVPGRFELVARAPDVVLDGAHNPGGMEALADSLPAFVGDRRLVAVVSVLDDKDAASMLSILLPVCDEVVFTANANPRALSPATLTSLARQVGAVEGHLTADPRDALRLAAGLAGTGGVVLATGSIYLIADLLRPPNAEQGSAL